MKRITLIVSIVLICVVWIGYTYSASRVPTPLYISVGQRDGYELRDYGILIVAETRVSAPYTDAVREGFERLYGYITGDNSTGETIAMTRPVLVEREKAQQANFGGAELVQETYRIVFIMPADRTLDTLPEPTDVRVMTRVEPDMYVAVQPVSRALWRNVFGRQDERFKDVLEEAGVSAERVMFARMSPPWAFPFMVRDEMWASQK